MTRKVKQDTQKNKIAEELDSWTVGEVAVLLRYSYYKSYDHTDSTQSNLRLQQYLSQTSMVRPGTKDKVTKFYDRYHLKSDDFYGDVYYYAHNIKAYKQMLMII